MRLNFNGFIVALDQPTGRTGPNELYEGSFSPMSVPHVLTLSGPEQGEWEIEQVTVEYMLEGEQPYAVSFGNVKLDATNQLQIWAERPLPTFDV